MEIDPSPCMITLKDGSSHTLFKFRDFLDLVDQEMGMDAAQWLETHVNQPEEMESDLAYYEAILESNTQAFLDLRKVLQNIHYLIETPWVDKHVVDQLLTNGLAIIKNNI